MIQLEEIRIKEESALVEKQIEAIEAYEEVERCMGSAINHVLEELKEANNEYQHLIGSIRVVVRIRPFIPNDKPSDQLIPVLNVPSRNDLILKVPFEFLRSGNHQDTFPFTFERVYPHTATQDNLFSELASLIQSSIDGYNICIFSYGQTGAGKTYTMLGGGEGYNQGLLPRTVSMLFDRAKNLEKVGVKCSFSVCFSEIYNNKMVDLLDEKKSELNDLVSSIFHLLRSCF